MGVSFTGQDEDKPLSEINITPFVDVMLVLLVIFMLTTPMMENGIPLQLPKVSTKPMPMGTEKPVTLSITKKRLLYLQNKEVPFEGLEKTLARFFKGRREKAIFIRADGELPYSFVAQTMAKVKASGIHKVGLVTIPEEPKEANRRKK